MNKSKYNTLQVIVIVVTFLISSIIFELMMDFRYVMIPKALAVIPSLIVFLIYKNYLSKNYPNVQRLVNIEEHDERNIALRNQAYFYAANAALILLMVFNAFSELINPGVQLGSFISLVILFLCIVLSYWIVLKKSRV